MTVIDTSKSLPALFAKQVQATPHAPALEDESGTYTYAELDEKVSGLAHHLSERGVKRDTLVGGTCRSSEEDLLWCSETPLFTFRDSLSTCFSLRLTTPNRARQPH